MAEEKSFADMYAAKSRNNLSKLLKKEEEKQDTLSQIIEKQEKKMTTETLNMKSSFGGQSSSTDSTKTSKADLIYLVKGIDDNRNAWYYVLVERLKLSLFLKALNDDIIHLENYGEILYSAYGDEPPQEITDKLKEEYGIK